jgi:O-antigen/teichoic acid export membrane protein
VVRQVTRDTLWNAGGAAVPVAAALWAFPRLLGVTEPDAFGWLSLGWVLLGAGGLFDFGLGRALAREVSGRSAVVSERVQAGLQLSLLAGVAFALTGLLAAPMVTDWVGAGALAREDVVAALRVLACSLPAVVLSSALRGVLEGEGRFFVVNAIRGPSIAAGFVLPLAVEPRLPWLMTAAVVGRWLALAAYGGCVGLRRTSMAPPPDPRAGSSPVPAPHAGPGSHRRFMLAFGGAVTLTSVFALVLSHADRVLVARVLGPAALATWSPAFEVVSRVLLFPVAFASALFPRMVSWSATPGRGLKNLVWAGIAVAGALVLPMIGLYAAMPRALDVWLGSEIDPGVIVGARWIVLGVFFNALAQIPFAFLQASGRPGIAALINGLELPVYVLGLLFLLRSSGIAGAGMAWAIRATVDAGLMYVAAFSVLRRGARP